MSRAALPGSAKWSLIFSSNGGWGLSIARPRHAFELTDRRCDSTMYRSPGVFATSISYGETYA
jgi:hypothetical protein